MQTVLIEKLKKLNLSVSTAESCTGGNIARLLTGVSGCSEVYIGGIVAYSNQVKQNILGVKPETLEKFGAVSIPTVEEMAEGACKTTAADCSMATSGIAGPLGGTKDKPVGTVCIAVKSPDGIVSKTCHFDGDRARIISQASDYALGMLIGELEKLSI